MKKLIYLSLGLFLLSSCTKDISSLNDFTKAPANVPAGSLFSNASRVLSDNLASASVNTNVFRFTVKHWAMTTYQDEVQYNFSTRAINRSWWNAMYRDVLNDLKSSSEIVNADATLLAEEKANKLAIIDVLQVYAYTILVNTFGNVPYTDALDAAKLFPKYDDAKTVTADLMKRLSADLSKMTPGTSFTSTEDLINKGNTAKWIKFASTLQMKLAMTIADADNTTAKTAFEAVNAGAISSAADNSAFVYLPGSPNQNPLFVDIVTGGRGDYVAAKDLLDSMTSFSDPRIPKFFAPNSSGAYRGGTVGTVNGPISSFSQPGAMVILADAPNILLDYVEAEFYRAEAKERGYTVSGTAEEHYNNAITASIIYWGGTAAEATAYLANPKVAYSTAAGTWKQKIGTQKWIALYNRPYEGWTELRRLDYPKLTLPVGATSGFPNRFVFPEVEQTTNGASYTEAATAVGGDKVETKLWWDKF